MSAIGPAAHLVELPLGPDLDRVREQRRIGRRRELDSVVGQRRRGRAVGPLVEPRPEREQDLIAGRDRLNQRAFDRDDPAVQGGKALRVDVRRKGANPWDIAVESTIEQPVKAGDSLVFAFWARLEKGEDGAATGTLPYNAVQVSAAPYTTLFSAPADIGPEWKLHEVRGVADADHAAGTLKATIHLASSAQTVDLGPLIVVNLGQE